MDFMRWHGSDHPVSADGAVTRMTLRRDQDAPRAARAAIAPLCTDASEDVRECAALLATELVTNAVKFGGGSEVRVAMWRSDDSVAVVVSDDGPGFDPAATTPRSQRETGGLGLPLVDALAHAWGSGTGDESWVWFELATEAA